MTILLLIFEQNGRQEPLQVGVNLVLTVGLIEVTYTIEIEVI